MPWSDPNNYWIMLVSIDRLAERTATVQATLHEELRKSALACLERAGVDSSHCRLIDREEGILLLISPVVRVTVLLRELVRCLDDELDYQQELYQETRRLRLRVGLHQGPVIETGSLVVSEQIRFLTELVTAGPVRKVLADTAAARMVVVVSEQIHQTVVLGGYRGIRAATFREIVLREESADALRAWVTVPGFPHAPEAEVPPEQQARVTDPPVVQGDAVGQVRFRLGAGAQGTVFAVARPPVGLPGQLAYKEFRSRVLREPAVLEQMVGFPRSLDAAERAFLESRLVWPLALVQRRSETCGFLMRRIPPEFLLDTPELSGPRPKGLEFLFNDEQYLRRIGLPVDHRQRLHLLKDLAEIVSWLHRHDVVFGDLSPKNVLFTLDYWPRCLLIDCDSVQFGKGSALAPVETTGWEAPEEEKPTPASDAFKFGLMALRLFNHDQDSRDSGPLGAVSPELEQLALLSLDADPVRRPLPTQWLEPLDQALADRGTGVVSVEVDDV